MLWPANSLFFDHPDISGISFDSRSVKSGDLFIALKGSTFDGHDFVLDAFKNGAVCALVERPICSDNIVVPSALEAFVRIASLRRSLFQGKVIAITGSVGKSTFRTSLVRSLSFHFNVQTSIKNFNTLVGLSHFFSQIDLASDFLVVELGIDKIGEMLPLVELSLPHYGLLTTIASAHSYSLGSLFSILQEKSIIFKKTSLRAFFPENLWFSPFLIQLMATLDLPFSTFVADSFSRQSFINAGQVLFSVFNIDTSFEVTEIAGRRELFSLVLPSSISLSIIDSSYNANFASMLEELKFFATLSLPAKKIAILGEMFGYDVRHHEILELFLGSFECWLVGEKMYSLSLQLKGSRFFSSVDDLLLFLAIVDFDTDTAFLIKASNCVGLSKVVSFFKFLGCEG